MTSTTRAAVTGADNAGAASLLITAVADALDDLGLKRLVGSGGVSTTGNQKEQEEEQAYHRSVWRAYQEDRGGMSLAVARKLLGMALTAQEMQSLLRNRSVVGRGGIMTWGDIEAVCREMGCPTCCCTESCTSGEEIDHDDDGDGKAHRKLELTLFLATEAECRRLSKIGTGLNSEEASSQPISDTSPPSATPNAHLLQKLIELSPPGTSTELSDDQLKFALQQTTNATSDQIHRILECNRALRADYSLRKKMMMQKFDATAIAMARSRRHAKGSSDQNKVKSKETSADVDAEEKEVAMDPVEMEIREIASSLANLDISPADTNNKAVDSGEVLVQQFLLPSTRFAPVTQTQIMIGDIDTYDRGGRVDQDNRNSMPAWQKNRKDGPPPRTPPRTLSGGKPPTASSKKKKTPKKQSTPQKDEEMKDEVVTELKEDIKEVEMAKQAPSSTPKNAKKRTPKKAAPKQKEEAKDAISDSGNKLEENIIKEVEKTKEAPSSTPKSARRRRGKGKSKGDASRPNNETPDTTSKRKEIKDAAVNEPTTPVKSPKSCSEDAKDTAETPSVDSSAKNKISKRRRPKKSGEATTLSTSDNQNPTTGKDTKRDSNAKPETSKDQAPKEGQDDRGKRGSRRRNWGRGKPGQKSNEGQEGKG